MVKLQRLTLKQTASYIERSSFTAPHPSTEKDGVDHIEVPVEYIVGKVAEKCINEATGEVIVTLTKKSAGSPCEPISSWSQNLEVLFTNDLDHDPFMSETLRIDSTRPHLCLVEIYRMMRPGEPQRKKRQKLFKACSSLKNVTTYPLLAA